MAHQTLKLAVGDIAVSRWQRPRELLFPLRESEFECSLHILHTPDREELAPAMCCVRKNTHTAPSGAITPAMRKVSRSWTFEWCYLQRKTYLETGWRMGRKRWRLSLTVTFLRLRTCLPKGWCAHKVNIRSLQHSGSIKAWPHIYALHVALNIAFMSQHYTS